MAVAQPSSGLPAGLPRSFFTNSDSHPCALSVALLKTFGPEWMLWEPKVLWVEIARLTGGTPSEHNKQKIQAARLLLANDFAWEDWQVLEKVIQSLNNNLPDFVHLQGCTPAQLWAGLDMMEAIRTGPSFSVEALRYIAACMRHAEVWYCPGPLAVAQQYVSEPRYRCNDCDYDGDAETGWNGHCELCSGTFEGLKVLSFKPKREARNVTTYNKYDPGPVKKIWDRIKGMDSDRVALGGTAAEIQAAKLLVARDYVRHRKNQFMRQMRWLD